MAKAEYEVIGAYGRVLFTSTDYDGIYKYYRNNKRLIVYLFLLKNYYIIYLKKAENEFPQYNKGEYYNEEYDDRYGLQQT